MSTNNCGAINSHFTSRAHKQWRHSPKVSIRSEMIVYSKHIRNGNTWRRYYPWTLFLKQLDSPFKDNAVALFIVQLMLILILSRILGKLLKFVKQPFVIAEMVLQYSAFMTRRLQEYCLAQAFLVYHRHSQIPFFLKKVLPLFEYLSFQPFWLSLGYG